MSLVINVPGRVHRQRIEKGEKDRLSGRGKEGEKIVLVDCRDI